MFVGPREYLIMIEDGSPGRWKPQKQACGKIQAKQRLRSMHKTQN
jgi:hypothetical protein